MHGHKAGLTISLDLYCNVIWLRFFRAWTSNWGNVGQVTDVTVATFTIVTFNLNLSLVLICRSVHWSLHQTYFLLYFTLSYLNFKSTSTCSQEQNDNVSAVRSISFTLYFCVLWNVRENRASFRSISLGGGRLISVSSVTQSSPYLPRYILARFHFYW